MIIPYFKNIVKPKIADFLIYTPYSLVFSLFFSFLLIFSFFISENENDGRSCENARSVAVFSFQNPAFADHVRDLGELLGRKNQRKTYIPFAATAECRARGAQHTRLAHQLFAEGIGVGVARGKRCPHQHCAVAVGNVPAVAAPTAAPGIPFCLLLGALVFDVVARARKCRDCRLLDGRKHAEIVLGAQELHRLDHAFIAD